MKLILSGLILSMGLSTAALANNQETLILGDMAQAVFDGMYKNESLPISNAMGGRSYIEGKIVCEVVAADTVRAGQSQYTCRITKN